MPGAENHVLSFDETDVCADETKRDKAPALRGVHVAEPGSRRGHGAARVGRDRDPRRGWVMPAKERAMPLDSGESAAAKGGAKFTYVAADLMSGAAAPTLIISQLSSTALAKKVKPHTLDAVGPVSAVVDPTTGKPRGARYAQSDSAGMESEMMTMFLEDVVLPSLPDHGADTIPRLKRKATRFDPDDVVLCDGLKQHHGLQWMQASHAKRVRTCLRYSHGSQDNQHEDFVNFAEFQPAFEKEKLLLRADKINALGEEPSAQARVAAGKLTHVDVLRCAKSPWERAFSREKVAEGWAKEGVFPKFNCALYACTTHSRRPSAGRRSTKLARPWSLTAAGWPSLG